MADAYQLVHRSSGHVLGDDDGSGDTEDGAKARLAVLIGDLGEVFLCVCECASHDGERSEKDNDGLLPTASDTASHCRGSPRECTIHGRIRRYRAQSPATRLRLTRPLSHDKRLHSFSLDPIHSPRLRCSTCHPKRECLRSLLFHRLTLHLPPAATGRNVRRVAGAL